MKKRITPIIVTAVIVLPVLASSIIPLLILGVITKPILWCEHEREVISDVESTCETQGETVEYCSICNDEKTIYKSLLEHTYEIISTTNASCTEKGEIKSKCTLCGNEKVEYVDRLAHNWIEKSLVEPTCTERGKITHECTYCGKEKYDYIDKIEHFWAEESVSGTIYKNKVKITKKCRVCGEETTERVESNSKHDNAIKIDYKKFVGVISDKTLIENICKAFVEVGIDVDKISSLERIDDWVAGERYTFVYLNSGFIIYTNMDSTVYSINFGVSTQIYLQGYEPYHIDNYIVDSSMSALLEENAKNLVKAQLNFPSTADFPWLDWTFTRDHNLYSVSSYVKAKNAFGIEDKISFTIMFNVQAETTKLIYFVIDDVVLVNETNKFEKPARKEIAIDNTDYNINPNEITLVYGKLGEYGKEIVLDGEKYIDFYVPYGTYLVKNNVKWCVISVAKDEYYKNSSGWMENETVESIVLDTENETVTITVNEGEHIELTVQGSVTLFPQ